MVGLIGPDGVGKSTLLALIAGARKRCKPARVEVLGGDMAELATAHAICPRIAYMPQGPGQESLSRSERPRKHRILRSPVRPGARRARMRASTRCCDGTGLAPFADRPAGKLSGGMRQKLGLCCCADPRSRTADPGRADHRRRSAVAPAVLGADRPHARAPPGMSVLVATAYMEEAERFDWLVAMDAGQVLAHAARRAELKRATGARDARGGLHRPAAGRSGARPPRADAFRRAPPAAASRSSTPRG